MTGVQTCALPICYGDFVLYRPPVKPVTWALWFGPGILLLLAGYGVWRLVRRKPESADAETPLTEAQRARARALLQDNDANQ